MRKLVFPTTYKYGIRFFTLVFINEIFAKPQILCAMFSSLTGFNFDELENMKQWHLSEKCSFNLLFS